MLVHHQLARKTFGRVLSLRDDQTGEVATRPNGSNRTEQYTERDIRVTWTPADPAIAATFGVQSDVLPSRTYIREVPDVDPLWQAWLDAGRINDELLADVPEADEAIFSRAKAAKIAAIDAWLVAQDEAGIDVGGFYLKSDANAATQLSVYLSTLTPGVDTILVSDVLGVPHIVEWPDLQALTDAFKSEFNRRRIAWATAKGAAMQASTLEELNAVQLPK